MRNDADDFSDVKMSSTSLHCTPGAQVPGPLFARIEGPFQHSKIHPNKTEVMVACLVWQHRGHEHPISIDAIIRSAGMPGLDPRSVKDVVAELVVTHRCRIGSKRDDPAGYFWIVTPEDERVAIAQYRAQIIQMGRRLRVLASTEAYRELLGQLSLLEEAS